MKKTEQEKLFAVKNFHGPSIKCFNVITLDYAFEHVLTLTLSHCSNSVLTPDPKHCSHKICCINTNNTCLNTCHYSKIGVLTLTREPWSPVLVSFYSIFCFCRAVWVPPRLPSVRWVRKTTPEVWVCPNPTTSPYFQLN